MVEGRTSEQKEELDQQLGLDGQGRIDLTDEFIPDDLRKALEGRPVPSWWDNRGDGPGAVRGLLGA